MKRLLSYVSLFSGAGGLDLGLEMAGWRTAFASDVDPFAVETLKANVGRKIQKGLKAFEGTVIDQADVRALTARTILDRAGMSPGDVQMLAGGRLANLGAVRAINLASAIREVNCSTTS